MWKLYSFFAVLSLLTPLAFAQDEVRFFDGYKHGWKTTFHMLEVSSETEAVYIGFQNSKEKKGNLIKYYNVSSNLEINNYIPGSDISSAYSNGVVRFLHDRMFYGLLSGKNIHIIFNFEGKSDDRLILIRGKKKKYFYTIGREDSEEGVWSYFKYNNIVRSLKNGDLVLAGEEEPYVFVLPHLKLHKIIARDNLFYAPMRYVAMVWRKTSACPPLPLKDEASLADLDKCLEAIFKTHPKGEFNVDFPDTSNYRDW
jgi:hypothetical protein